MSRPWSGRLSGRLARRTRLLRRCRRGGSLVAHRPGPCFFQNRRTGESRWDHPGLSQVVPAAAPT
eukprot:2299065-Pyramimonas_sp.AAC.1